MSTNTTGAVSNMDTELDELRARVDRNRRKKERNALLDELYGRQGELDEGVIYLSVRELAEAADCARHIILHAITAQHLPARKSGRAYYRRDSGPTRGRRCKWFIHPDDAKRWAKEVLNVDLKLVS